MVKYYVRFRHIPFELMFTPLYMISVDHIQVESKIDSNEYDLEVAICNELKNLNWNTENIRIESIQIKL